MIDNFYSVFSGLLESETSKLESQLKKQQARLSETQGILLKDRNEAEREIAERVIRNDIAKIEKQISNINENYTNAFEWRFEFPEVLDDEGKFLGFDLVIANPPYIRQEWLGKLKSHLQKKYKVFVSGGDIFSYFYELSFSILKENGKFAFINNTFDKTKAGKVLRKFVKSKFSILKYIDFTSVSVFDEVTTYPIILIAEKKSYFNNFQYFKFDKDSFVSKEIPDTDNLFTFVSQKSLNPNAWNFIEADKAKLLEKINVHKTILEVYGKCYYGVKTSLNDAFITSVNLGEYQVLKPVFEGKDVKKWFTPYIQKKIIVFESKSTKRDIGNFSESLAFSKMFEKYPEIMKHLLPFEEMARKRYDQGEYWWESRNCAYYPLFEKTKIIFPNLQSSNKFAFDETKTYLNAPAVFLPTDDKYLLAVLNSKVVWHFLKSICVVRNGGFIEVKPQYFEQIPIPTISPEAQKPFIKLVDEILELKKQGANTDEQEKRIDKMVYELYELTTDEIKIVEGNS